MSGPLRVVIAPQSLKGSLAAPDVASAIERGLRAVAPDAMVERIPVADGGEGTVEALVAATGGEARSVSVTGPLGTPVEAVFGLLGVARGERPTAVIEMAAASGLPLVPPDRRDARITTTYGTGELMRAALDAGCRDLLIGIGGSATNDGGAGMAQALGVRLLDADGHELERGGAALARLERIDMAGLDPRLGESRVRVACDVTNPLTGPQGASAVYGPQKGATPQAVRELDAALGHYAAILRRDLGADVADVPGAGAAGGLGAGLLAFAKASLVPGAGLVLDALRFAERIAGAELVITAEGQLDEQTAYGKSVGAVAGAARAAGARVIALCGNVAGPPEAFRALGIDAVVPIPDGPMRLEEALARAQELVERAAERAMALVLIGKGLTTN